MLFKDGQPSEGMTKIVEVTPVRLKNPVLIEGFPGVGMVGTIAAMHIVKELNMDLVGYIDSEKFPPFCAIHNGAPLPPARLYQSKKHNVIVLLSEFVIPLGAVSEVTHEIISWSEDRKVRAVFSLGGIGIGGSDKKVFGVATTPELKSSLEKAGVTIINEGVTTGVTGLLLSNAFLRKFPAASILTTSKDVTVNLIGAASVLDKLGKVLGISFNPKTLEQEGIELENKINDMLKNTETAKKKYTEIESPMYR